MKTPFNPGNDPRLCDFFNVLMLFKMKADFSPQNVHVTHQLTTETDTCGFRQFSTVRDYFIPLVLCFGHCK